MASGLAEASPHFLQVSDILCDVRCALRDVRYVMYGEPFVPKIKIASVNLNR